MKLKTIKFNVRKGNLKGLIAMTEAALNGARRPYALNQKAGAIASARDKSLRSERRENRVLIRRGWFD